MKVTYKKETVDPLKYGYLNDSRVPLTVDKTYVVLAMYLTEDKGMMIFIQGDRQNKPLCCSLTGFEVIDVKQPSSWKTFFRKQPEYPVNALYLGPAAWSDRYFEEDLDAGKKEAVEAFLIEAKKIYEAADLPMPDLQLG